VVYFHKDAIFKLSTNNDAPQE